MSYERPLFSSGGSMKSADVGELFAIAVDANEVFSKLYEESVTSVGVTRNPHAFDAVTIDCALSGKRIAIVVKADIPGVVAAGVGTRGADGPDNFSETPLAEFNAEFVLKIMQDNFARRPA